MAAGHLEDIVTGNKYSDAPKWMQVAAGELGQKETDPYSRVKNYFESDGVVPDPRGTPWCRYFVNYCLREADWSVPNGGMARGLLNWGDKIDLTDAKVGDIIILWRGTHDDGVSGHIGFFIKEDAYHVYLIGGNQGDAVTEGKFLKTKVIGVRRPRSLWSSKTIRASVGTKLVGATEVVNGISTPSVEAAVEAKNWFGQVMDYLPNYRVTIGCIILALGLYILLNKMRETKNV